MKKTAIVKNTSTVTINGLLPGQSLKIPVSKTGMPLQFKWRKSLKDAKIDRAIKIDNSYGDFTPAEILYKAAQKKLIELLKSILYPEPILHPTPSIETDDNTKIAKGSK